MDDRAKQALRSLPAVHEVLRDERLHEAQAAVSPDILAEIVRQSLAQARESILRGTPVSADQVVADAERDARSLVAPEGDIIINGTGVVIHTNLGRSPVSAETAAVMAANAGRYQALELHRSTGKRGGRGSEVSRLMRLLTGAEKTLVVNNNAAAVLLTLAATTVGHEVIVSRGEAVEIGGGFRIPDVLTQSGATLVEVGTTNRTYLRDYEDATTAETAAYLKVHASNFEISGFTASPALADLAGLAQRQNVLLIEDVGSGCLLDASAFGLQYEPTLTDSITAGVDVVCASGDKLLGGPQAGIIAGRADLIERIARHPLARALRADKTCLAGLAETLRHYVCGDATERIPVWWSISRSPEWLKARVEDWISAIDSPAVNLLQTQSVVGGGSLPGRSQPSFALAIDVDHYSADEVARRLRVGSPAVMPRVVDDLAAIDARTVLQDEDEHVIDAVRQVLI